MPERSEREVRTTNSAPRDSGAQLAYAWCSSNTYSKLLACSIYYSTLAGCMNSSEITQHNCLERYVMTKKTKRCYLFDLTISRNRNFCGWHFTMRGPTHSSLPTWTKNAFPCLIISALGGVLLLPLLPLLLLLASYSSSYKLL